MQQAMPDQTGLTATGVVTGLELSSHFLTAGQLDWLCQGFAGTQSLLVFFLFCEKVPKLKKIVSNNLNRIKISAQRVLHEINKTFTRHSAPSCSLHPKNIKKTLPEEPSSVSLRIFRTLGSPLLHVVVPRLFHVAVNPPSPP